MNLAFREPLSGAVELPDVVPGSWFPAESPVVPTPIAPGPATVVIAGSRAGEVAEDAARRLGAPLLAEIASGAHFGPNLVLAYRELLATEGFGDRIERVVVFGHPTLSREVPALIERGDVETIVVRSPGVDDYNPGRRVATFADAVTVVDDPDAVQASRSWVGRWVAASRELLAVDEAPAAALTDDYVERARFARDQLGQLRAPVTRRVLAEAVWNATWPHDRLVVGASRLIRELDKVAPGKKIRVHANRGLAGIDGTIATATGIALASQRDDAPPGITRVLLGDLVAAARRRLAARGRRRGVAAHPADRRQRPRRHDLRRARGGAHDRSGARRPRAAHPAGRRHQGARGRLRLGVPSRREPRRSRRSAHPIRRPGHRRSTPGALMLQTRRSETSPSCCAPAKASNCRPSIRRRRPGSTGGKCDGARALAARDAELAELQELLFAERRLGRPSPRAAGAAGHGHRGQGRDREARRRLGRPAGRSPRVVQGADGCGEDVTTSCGASASRFRRSGSSASSTARTTRTCSSPGCASWPRPR